MGTGKAINALFIIGFLGIVWLMIMGNLSGNLGFSSGDTGYAETESVIGNLTAGSQTFFSFANTWFTILAIVLLIVILVGLLAIVMKISKLEKGGGFSG